MARTSVLRCGIVLLAGLGILLQGRPAWSSNHIARVEYRRGGGWRVVPRGPLYVLLDTTVTLRAIPERGKWHGARVRWSGPWKFKRHGAVCEVQFSRQARHRGDFHPLTVSAGSRWHSRILVYDLEPTMAPVDIFPGRDMHSLGVGEDVRLGVKITPPVPVRSLGGLQWATDRFPGTATVVDPGAGDGKAMFNVGDTCKGFDIRLRLRSGLSAGEWRSITMAATPVGKSIIDPQYRALFQDMAEIDRACETMKLARMEHVAAVMEVKWRTRGTKPYLTLVDHICNLLDTMDWGSDHRFTLAQQYARRALPIAKKSSPGAEAFCLIHLLRDLEFERGAARGEEWQRLRREKAVLWLTAIRTVNESIDWTFNPYSMSSLPLLNVSAPVLPRTFLDNWAPWRARRMQAAYRAAVTKNDLKAKRLNRETEYRRSFRELWTYGEDYMVRAYCKAPTDVEELRGLLRAYDVEPLRAERIVRRVRVGFNHR